MNSFDEDLAFLRAHTEVIVLASPDGRAQVAVVPAFQARVMTSTADGGSGTSFGYLHRPVIQAGTRQPQMTVVGGEDRFWLGPEGGQFGLYFPPGSPFSTEYWQVPEPIDWGAWGVIGQTRSAVACRHTFSITNHSGTRFDMRVDRTIRVLDDDAAARVLGQTPGVGTRVVAFESDNRMTNVGRAAWTRETGVPSIWISGVFPPAPRMTVVLPFVPGEECDLGPSVNDSYFGKIPSDRLVVRSGAVFFRGDGLLRGKLGIPAGRARDVVGSYDPDHQILTIVQFTMPAGRPDYVNAMWEHQAEPFRGDVSNAYNDGPFRPGEAPLGPFYEIESSSPAAVLGPDAGITHVHRTIHLQGPEGELDPIARMTLGVSLGSIISAIP